MDFDHFDMYNHLLTRKCTCGGEPEMLIDFVDDFEVRCSKCHLSTHAYMDPEDAAKHWNDGDDIKDEPLHILWDDPEGWLQGEVAAIYISDEAFCMVNEQSCDFQEAIFEYSDKIYSFEHEVSGINIGSVSSFDRKAYKYKLKPTKEEKISFEKIIYSEHGCIDTIVFRWGDTWLFVFASEHDLILTRSSFDLTGDGYPEAPVEPMLCFEVN